MDPTALTGADRQLHPEQLADLPPQPLDSSSSAAAAAAHRHHPPPLSIILGGDSSSMSPELQKTDPPSATQLNGTADPFPAVGSTSSIPIAAQELLSASAAGQQLASAVPTTLVPEQVTLLPAGWCDICRVQCEINNFDMHKNGKWHKKIVKNMEEMEARQKLMTGLQAKVAPLPQMTLGIEGQSTIPKRGIEAQTEAPTDALAVTGPKENQSTDGYNERDILDLNIGEISQGGKRMKYIEQDRVDDPKKQPRICTLCNAVCVSLTIFERHLAGKKHTSRSKRFQRQDNGLTISKIETKPETQVTDALPVTGSNENKSTGGSYTERDCLKRNIGEIRQGGKRMKYSEHECNEYPKEQLMVCTLCNIKCNSLANFEDHLAGKKHTYRVKHLQRQDTSLTSCYEHQQGDVGLDLAQSELHQENEIPAAGVQKAAILSTEASTVSPNIVYGPLPPKEPSSENTQDVVPLAIRGMIHQESSHQGNGVQATSIQETFSLEASTSSEGGERMNTQQACIEHPKDKRGG